MSCFSFSFSSSTSNSIGFMNRGGVQCSQLHQVSCALLSYFLLLFLISALFHSTPMTKKKSSKMTPIVVEEEKPSSVPKKSGNEIDEIFAGKKRKKSEQVKTEKPNEDVTKRPDKTKKKNNMKKKIKGSDDGEFVDPPSRPIKRTEDGLAIYTEDELGFNKADAGGTPLCPFDCSCCF